MLPGTFRLRTDLTPKGDQPKAIAELADGVLSGLREQVLLGATGTGKSLPGDEPVWLAWQEGGTWRHGWRPLGEVVEEALQVSGVPAGADPAVAYRHPKGYHVAAVSPEDGRISLAPVGGYSRHASPDRWYRCVLESGRTVRVTPDHNLWVRRTGEEAPVLLPTDRVRVGDRVPVPCTTAEEAVGDTCRWEQVLQVEEIRPDGDFVYDLSVPGWETFLAGRGGGVFVHNTFTMAGVIERVQRPTLVLAHNKTLAAQLAGEFKAFFPDNAVEYFVSYYDYYQPEAYIPTTDTYIEKDAMINDEIDKLRHAATTALFERRDVIIVASVSCIYGLGSPEDYRDLCVSLRVGTERDRDEVIRRLVAIQYTRNEVNFQRSTFRVRGDVLEIFPAASTERAIRVEFFGDTVERITEVDVVTGEVVGERHHVAIYPASHYVTPPDKRARAIQSIEEELEERLRELRSMGKLLEAQRLEQRTRHDLEMLELTGTCAGIENYSRHLTGRRPGQPPYTLLDFFPPDFLLIVDESHQTIPQVRAMYNGDRSRKESLVEYGFRLPSAFDNRPLTFEEFTARINQVIYVSATPAPYELSRAQRVVEQIVRPTGLLDPEVEVRPTRGQVDDLLREIRARVAKDQRVLVTTLTKKMAEDLTEYLREVGVKVRYLHSDIDTLERMQIVRDLRLGEFHVLVGINLLREGLDLPEVSLVAILDADKEGFLRSETSLIQTIGRAARNAEGKVILYADTVTEAMARAIAETERRRAIQREFNEKHGIVPTTVKKAVRDVIEATRPVGREAGGEDGRLRVPVSEVPALLERLRREMREAARQLEFERAAALRDLIIELEARRREGKGDTVEVRADPALSSRTERAPRGRARRGR